MTYKALIATAVALHCGGALAADVPPAAVDSQVYIVPQQLAAVDGARRINYFCMGTGEPTVVFDAGLGNSMMTWRRVQGQVSAMTRACAYDRAGYGFSDPANRASDVRNAVDDLHHLLVAAHFHTPIIYVGHSIAGLYGAYLTAVHPQDVAGAVLIDPSFAHKDALLTAKLPPADRLSWNAEKTRAIAAQRNCLLLQNIGALDPATVSPTNPCIGLEGMPRPFGSALTRAIVREQTSVANLSAELSEMESVATLPGLPHVDDDEMDSIKVNFGARPLMVLTRANPDGVWWYNHEALARTSTSGQHKVVPNAGHRIQLDQPGAVIDAVRSVVADVRARAAPGR